MVLRSVGFDVNFGYLTLVICGVCVFLYASQLSSLMRMTDDCFVAAAFF